MQETLSRLPFWKELNEKQKKYISDNTTIRHYKKTVLFTDVKTRVSE